MNRKEFLSHNPSLDQIIEFAESEAQRIAKERKKAMQAAKAQR